MHTCPQAEICENNTEEHRDLFRHFCFKLSCPDIHDPLHQRRYIHRQCPKYDQKQGSCCCDIITSSCYQYFLDIFHSNDFYQISGIENAWIKTLGFTICQKSGLICHCKRKEYSSGQRVTLLNNYKSYEFIGWKMIDKCQNDSNYCIVADMESNSESIFNTRLIQVPYGCVEFESLNIMQPWSHPSVLVFNHDRVPKLFDCILARRVSGLENITFLQVLQEFYFAGIPVFIVGGAVRDVTIANNYQMNIIEQIGNIKDIDLGFGDSAQAVLDLMRKKGWKCSMNRQTGLVSIGDKNGTFLEGKSINGLNSDRYKLDTETLASMGTNLYVDTLCRDFTMNSLWYDAMNRVIIDPTGQGLRDTLNKLLKIPIPWEDRMLWVQGNPTKLIRYWKFIARGYKPADKKMQQFIIEQATIYYRASNTIWMGCK